MAKYRIDFEKVKTLEDVIKILEGLDITVHGQASEFPKLKEYLILDVDIPPGTTSKYKA